MITSKKQGSVCSEIGGSVCTEMQGSLWSGQVGSLSTEFPVDQAIEFIPLGKGKITFIDKQPTLTKGKYNLLLEATMDNGQSILVSKLFDDLNFIPKIDDSNEIETLIKLAKVKLKPKTLEKLKEFLSKQKKLPKGQYEVIMELIKNEE
jgi:hypothetical protein